MSPRAPEQDLLLPSLRVRRGDGRPWVDLADAVTDPPVLTLTMDGASSVEIPVRDARDRLLLHDDWLTRKAWLDVGGRRFEFVGIRKSGRTVTVTFEDALVAALRRESSRLSIPAGSMTRAAIMSRLCREAEVPLVVDDSDDEKVHRQVTRSVQGSDETSWDLMGSLAEERNWRRFSDGRTLVVGPDEWLLKRDADPVRINEPAPGQGSNPVDSIDFVLDTGRRASSATVTVDATRWAFPPGSVVLVDDDMGPAAGRWLVSSFTRPLTRSRATVQLVRKRHELDEPPAAGAGDRGRPGYLPTEAGVAGVAASGARERMVSYALAQSGKRYVMGASGPDAFDCSGLVQEATRAGGRVLLKPSASQASAAAKGGRVLTVAEALRTRGALLFRIGVGSYNHVAISLGNGSTVEAMGSAYGVGVFGGAASRTWTSAALWI